jgi:hypothetical protein
MPKRLRGIEIALTVAAACAALTTAAPAAADPTRGIIDLPHALVQLDTFARTGAERPAAPASEARSGLERPIVTSEPYAQNPGNAWFGVAPRVAFVARDWASTHRLAGDRLSLVDALRLSQSTRMVMTRVRFGDAGLHRITPFAQIGMGQWRTDRQLMPFAPRSIELAGQIGGGVELHVTRAWQLAAESTMTALVREEREANDVPQTKLWSVMMASRLEF